MIKWATLKKGGTLHVELFIKLPDSASTAFQMLDIWVEMLRVPWIVTTTNAKYFILPGWTFKNVRSYWTLATIVCLWFCSGLTLNIHLSAWLKYVTKVTLKDSAWWQNLMSWLSLLTKSLWHLVTLCFMQCMLQDRQQESAEATEYHTNRMHLHKTRPKPRLQNPVKGLKVKQSPSVLIIRIDLQFSCRYLSIQSNTLTIS